MTFVTRFQPAGVLVVVFASVEATFVEVVALVVEAVVLVDEVVVFAEVLAVAPSPPVLGGGGSLGEAECRAQGNAQSGSENWFRSLLKVLLDQLLLPEGCCFPIILWFFLLCGSGRVTKPLLYGAQNCFTAGAGGHI